MERKTKLRLLLSCMVLTYFITQSQQMEYDVHLKLPENIRRQVAQLGQQITALAPNNEIDFVHTAQPHVTLYLTDYLPQNILALKQIVAQIVSPSYSCQISLTDVEVSGQYMLWNVDNSECLQNLSNIFVNALYELRNPNQPIPSWVRALPDPPRSEMIQMVKDYGSPNVFSFFAPHVTMAWDAVDDLNAVLQKIQFPRLTFIPDMLGIGTVGPHGTVLQNQDLANFTLSYKSL